MPPGAGTNLPRSVGLFGGHGAGRHAAVLAVWALAGATLLAVAAFRRPHIAASAGLAVAEVRA